MARYREAREPQRLEAARGTVPVFLNVEAGRGGESVRRRLTRTLERAGVMADLYVVPPERLAEAVISAADAGARVIAVAGGDGTLSTAAQALLGRRTALAPLPTGTLNHFARRLGITDVDTAARALAGGVIIPVTVGSANGRLFLNTFSVGVYADLVRYRERLRRRLTKWPATAAATAAVIARLRVIEVTLDVDGEHRHCVTPLIWVGAGCGSVPLSHLGRPAADPSVLEVALVSGRSRLRAIGVLIRVLARVLCGRPAAAGGALELWHARALVLRAGQGLEGTMDGEVERYDPPVRVQVQETALHVMMPLEPADRWGRPRS